VVRPRFAGVVRRYYCFVYGMNLGCLFWLFPSSVRMVPAVYGRYGCWLFMADVLQKREVSL